MPTLKNHRRHAALGHIHVHIAFVELAVLKQGAKFLLSVSERWKEGPLRPAATPWNPWEGCLDGAADPACAFLGDGLSFFPNRFLFPNLQHIDRQLNQIADHGLHVPPHISTPGKLGGLDLVKGESVMRERRSAISVLLTPVGLMRMMFLGRDLVLEPIRRPATAPPVSKRNGHRTFGLILADDIFIEFFNDFNWF